ncbi:hypothetical protein QLQ12_13695 [Actinoplanes sp. NEAU-A12]|uniref:Tat pathway signal sequence domain protein n=1 Tax=Actinoplanes sandaracinus TaxID=3045177 RepID=A0ABT6WIU0_9ACTN|nr:hypothetical protein [Actinoplanes sandaracinus]MDI6099651.1 hypothetical protein [Actinoplanes sandaracinus]
MLVSALRAKSMVAAAVITALTISGGAAWAFWRLSGTGNGTASAGSAVELRATGRPDPDVPLHPGARSNLFVTIRNDNRFRVIVDRVQPHSVVVAADPAHRDAGCIQSGVSMSSPFYSVSVEIPPQSSSTVLLSRAIRMDNTSDSACQGATFSVPLTLTGRSRAS